MPTSNNMPVAAKKSLPLAAQVWVNKARQKAKTNKMKQSFEIGSVVEEGNSRYSITIKNTAPEFAAYEFGSGLTSTKKPPARYLIESNKGKILKFAWKPALNIQYAKVTPLSDGTVWLPRVMHPGVKPEPAMMPALQESSQQMLQIIGQQFMVEVVYRSIRESFTVGAK